MKYLKNCPTLLCITFYALLILGPSSRLFAQEDVHLNLANFSILVETSVDEIMLTCHHGCAWKKLSFSSSIKSGPQAVDQYGMATLTSDLIRKDSLNSDFLFTIKKTQEGLSLEGKAGTIWPGLTFDCGGGTCSRTFDEYGMIDRGKK